MTFNPGLMTVLRYRKPPSGGGGTPPALDGHATGSIQSAATNSVTSAGLTTAHAGDVILAFVFTVDDSFTATRTVTSISGTGTTGWTKRKAIAGDTSSFKKVGLEEWWGTAAATLSNIPITANLSANADAATIIVCGASGANTSSPFDADASLPATSSDLDGTGSAPAATISTANAADLIFALMGTQESSPTFGDIQASYTAIDSVDGFNAGGTFVAAGSEAEYRAVSATQSSVSVGFTGTHNNYLLIVDAIKGA